MILLSPFQESWSQFFQSEKTLLENIFQKIPIAFHHIGSTAIKGAYAKPIIDILGVTNDITQIDTFNSEMQKLGYKPLGEFGMKQRRFFKKRDVHVHIFEDSDPESCRHLRFVNYLNAHSHEVKEYNLLKQRLAEQFPYDRESYTLGKEKWIKEIDIKAACQEVNPHFYPLLGPRKDVWSPEEIVNALHVNVHLQMIYFSKFIPTMELVFQPDVTCVQSTLADDTFNYVLSARFSRETVQKRVAEVTSLYEEKNLPFSWWLSPLKDTPDTLQDALLQHSFQLVEENIGMFRIENRNMSFNKDVIRARDFKTLQEFTEVLLCLGIHPALYEEIYSKIPPILYREGAPVEIYVLYAQNRPVTTGILTFHANVAGISYIATDPKMRRRGFATAMMEHLLARTAQKGYKIAILLASPEGKRVYEKIGFNECCKFLEMTRQWKS